MKIIEEIYSEIGNIKTLLKPDCDANYQRLLKGKNVAIVGPAETMIGTGQGSLIDSFDLVVRFNTVVGYLPFPDNLARDIGAKTDLLYSNNDILLNGIVGQKVVSQARFVQVCEKLSLKYIVSTNNDFVHKETQETNECFSEGEKFRTFLENHEIKAGFRMLFATSAAVRRWLRGHVGRTGFIAILDLLAYDIKRLYITGMTFYHKGGHLFLPDRVEEFHPLKDHKGQMPRDKSPGHNSYLELELMRAFSDYFRDKLELDDRLQMLLEGRFER